LLFTPANDLVPTDVLETTLNDTVSGDDVTVAGVGQRMSDQSDNVEWIFVCDTADDVDRVSLEHWSCRLHAVQLDRASDTWRVARQTHRSAADPHYRQHVQYGISVEGEKDNSGMQKNTVFGLRL